MILTGKGAEQYLEQEYRKEPKELIGFVSGTNKEVRIDGPEIERRLIAIASRNDPDSMRTLFRGFYSDRLRRGKEEGKTINKIRQNALWRMDQAMMYADARVSGIP